MRAEKGAVTINLHGEITEINNARQFIDLLDAERRQQGISQMKMAELLDDPDAGQRYAGTYGRGDAKLSYTIRMAKALGLKIVFYKELIEP